MHGNQSMVATGWIIIFCPISFRADFGPVSFWAGFDPVQKKHVGKFVIFSHISLLNCAYYWFVFLYCKDRNLVLRYPVFVKTLKNVFLCIQPCLLKKKIILYFHTIKKISKICISMHFGFNNQFIKVTRTRSKF